MAFPIVPIIGPVLGIVSDWLDGRRKLKQARLEGELKVTQAKTDAAVRIAETQQQMDANWNKLSIENSSWKDEWFVILLSIPMILCFIPGGAEHVRAGFDALRESTPEWYQYAFLVAVASSFGFKKLTELRRKP